ncbi:MAG TPA: hypothetical protein VMD09_13340 [Solirubrobacteraceae bacterium]|nr:hypothetical protein [Solirubrobacteraceae bacterium]
MLSLSRHSLVSSARLAGIGAIAATALAAAPVALAAESGGASVSPAGAHVASSAPFTIGVSAATVQPGAKLNISGLAYARAGTNLTITSNAIASAQFVNNTPAVQTPALVEGIYQTTVRITPAAEPGVYPVVLRVGNRQVASFNLRVVSPGSRSGGSTGAAGCAQIGFRVLHNDRADGAYLPAGGYTVSSRNMHCGTASADFTSFLAGGGKTIPGWNTTSPGAGRATFLQRNSGLTFSVAKTR